jgi:hypothetical protein
MCRRGCEGEERKEERGKRMMEKWIGQKPKGFLPLSSFLFALSSPRADA